MGSLNIGQVDQTHVPLSPSSIIWYQSRGVVMPCGWEGNWSSGVTLAMHHRLQWFIHLQAQGLRKGDENPAYTAELACDPACVDNTVLKIQTNSEQQNLNNASIKNAAGSLSTIQLKWPMAIQCYDICCLSLWRGSICGKMRGAGTASSI